MFTWICPKCGREVPPSYTECPDCSAREAGVAPAAPPQEPMDPAQAPAFAPPPPSPPPATFAPPPAAKPEYQPSAAPLSPLFAAAPPPPVRHERRGLPTWLLAILFTILFLGLGGGAYWYFTRPKAVASVESPAAKPGAPAHPWQKYVEITGVRFMVDKGQIQARFVVVNHSEADMVGLAGNATLWARTQKSEEDPVGTFVFQTSIGSGESKELTFPLKTKLKPMELPDWQNITVDLQITAPKAL
jgi:hypothetical protein